MVKNGVLFTGGGGEKGRKLAILEGGQLLYPLTFK